MMYVLIGMAGFIVGWVACALFVNSDDGGMG